MRAALFSSLRFPSSPRSGLALLGVLGLTGSLLVSAAACGGDDASNVAPPSSSGGSAGSAGATAGSAGAAGTSAGAAGLGGSSGAAGSSAGGAGAGACAKATDCTVPATTPASCAVATCENNKCVYQSADADDDGHRASACAFQDPKSAAGTIVLGDDCNDADATVFPGAWDGPAADGNPDRCGDGVDQNCSGADGDSVGKAGQSCSCTPGDVQSCDQDDSGKPIVFPGGKPVGACSSGSRTCVVDAITKAGVFGPCTGAVGPTKEICNGGIDDDCDGLADMADDDPPLNTATWSYDGDGDGFVTGSDARREWCADERPSGCPVGVPSCEKTSWKLGNLPSGDCNDTDDTARPDGVEKCTNDGTSEPKDADCNGKTNAPGAGDCACRDGDIVACASSDKTYPDSATAPSDQYPLATFDTQSGGLVGECRWGQKECVKGQWTGCHDGVGAKASEDCSKTDKKDYDCNGVPNRTPDNQPTSDCACAGGETVACGDCSKGVSTCVGGVFGPCQGDDAKVSYCNDADGDGVCGGNCELQCPDAPHGGKRTEASCYGSSSVVDCNDSSPTVGQNKSEACSAIDEDCDGNPYDGFDYGAACNNGLKGSCYRTGTKVCASTQTTSCNAGTWPDAPSASFSTTSLHASYDRNCDGVVEHKPTSIIFYVMEQQARRRKNTALTGCAAVGLQSAGTAVTTCKQVRSSFPSGTENYVQVVLCDGDEALSATSTAADSNTYKDPQTGTKYVAPCGKPYMLLSCNPNTDQAGVDLRTEECR